MLIHSRIDVMPSASDFNWVALQIDREGDVGRLMGRCTSLGLELYRMCDTEIKRSKK